MKWKGRADKIYLRTVLSPSTELFRRIWSSESKEKSLHRSTGVSVTLGNFSAQVLNSTILNYSSHRKFLTEQCLTAMERVYHHCSLLPLPAQVLTSLQLRGTLAPKTVHHGSGLIGLLFSTVLSAPKKCISPTWFLFRFPSDECNTRVKNVPIFHQ